MSGCLRDPQQAGKVDHSSRDLFAQRVFSIGCGYADANDSARLVADPMHKMLLDRDPVIWVVAIAPGAVETEMNREEIAAFGRERFEGWIPLGRIGNTLEITEASLFLISNEARYITGATLTVDGGYGLITIPYDARKKVRAVEPFSQLFRWRPTLASTYAPLCTVTNMDRLPVIMVRFAYSE